jgi:hypothetical protein
LSLWLEGDRHCEERSDEAIQLPFHPAPWIASLSLSSGAHSRDPLAGNDDLKPRFCWPKFPTRS